MNERDFSAKTKVSFGVRVPNSGPLASPDSIVQVAREAESLGYDSIWVHDHLHVDGRNSQYAYIFGV